MRGDPFEAFEIVADGHGKSQEFFKRLLGLLEFDRDVAGFQAHARRQVIKLLLEDCVLSFDQKLRFAQTFLTQRSNQCSDFPAAADLIKSVVASGQKLETMDQGIPVGQSVGSDAVSNTRGDDLLGAAAANSQEEFDGSAIDIRIRVGLEAPNNVRQITIPGGFGRHVLGYVSAHLRKMPNQ